jgi:hypothetical protein
MDHAALMGDPLRDRPDHSRISTNEIERDDECLLDWLPAAITIQSGPVAGAPKGPVTCPGTLDAKLSGSIGPLRPSAAEGNITIPRSLGHPRAAPAPGGSAAPTGRRGTCGAAVSPTSHPAGRRSQYPGLVGFGRTGALAGPHVSFGPNGGVVTSRRSRHSCSSQASIPPVNVLTTAPPGRPGPSAAGPFGRVSRSGAIRRGRPFRCGCRGRCPRCASSRRRVAGRIQ